jgi:hypothetical protein
MPRSISPNTWSWLCAKAVVTRNVENTRPIDKRAFKVGLAPFSLATRSEWFPHGLYVRAVPLRGTSR